MNTAATGTARKTKVVASRQKRKPDHSGQLPAEAIQAVLAADARARHVAREDWRRHLTLPGGKVLGSLALACWILTTSHGLMPEDAKGNPLGVRVDESQYQVGTSQLAALAGVSVRTMQDEIRVYLEEIAPHYRDDWFRPIVCMSGAVRERKQTQLLVREMGGCANFAQDDCAVFAQPAQISRLSVVPGTRQEGIDTVCTSRPLLNPPACPPTPQGGEAGGQAGEDPTKGQEILDKEVQVQEVHEEEPLTPDQEALSEVMIQDLGEGRRNLVDEAVRKCPLRLVRVYREAWGNIWGKALADQQAGRIRSAAAVVPSRVARGGCAEEVALWKAEHIAEVDRGPVAIKPEPTMPVERAAMAPRSLQELLETPTGRFSGSLLLDALEGFSPSTAEEDDLDLLVQRLTEAGPLHLEGAEVSLADEESLRRAMTWLKERLTREDETEDVA